MLNTITVTVIINIDKAVLIISVCISEYLFFLLLHVLQEFYKRD